MTPERYKEVGQLYRAALHANHGIAGGVRLCPHIYNTMEEIDGALAALRETNAR